MKQPPHLRFARLTLTCVAMSAWLLAANHCAIAGLLPKAPAASEHAECPGHPAPAGDEKGRDCDGSGCCKSLSAPLAVAKNLVGYDLACFAKVTYPAATLDGAVVRRAAVILELDTGPPDCSSFAESVLQRSILAHAPPVVA